MTARAPAGMPEGTPFDPGITSVIAYLHGCQMVSFKRLTEVCQGLFGLTISQSAIANMLARVGKAFRTPADRIAAEVRASEVIAGDETSARVKGKTWWQRSATAVAFVMAETRGKCVPTAFLAGAKPKMWLSDRLPAQCKHAEEHQFCLAHLIRDAQYAIDHGDTIFAPGFKALLKDACAVGRRRPHLAEATIAAHRRGSNGSWSGCSRASRPMPRAASCATRSLSTTAASCSQARAHPRRRRRGGLGRRRRDHLQAGRPRAHLLHLGVRQVRVLPPRHVLALRHRRPDPRQRDRRHPGRVRAHPARRHQPLSDPPPARTRRPW